MVGSSLTAAPVRALRPGLALLSVAVAAVGWSASACAARPRPLSTAAIATQTASARPTAMPASGEATPVTYTTPHPPPAASPLDGSYARLDSSWPQWWKCLRCADYRSAGGIWRLRFERGTMRVEYEVTGWSDLASYTVEADRLTVFNDPNCPEEVAAYRWQIQGGQLRLQALQDSCAFGLRAENLETEGWQSCTRDGRQPPGCAAAVTAATGPASPPAGISISVQGGDSRFFATPPESPAPANAEDNSPPAGIHIIYSPKSVGYGLNRILWWEGNWIEVSTELPVTAMGVQFLGAAQTGWARLLLDGQEVWRGKTAELGHTLDQYGGYVEVTGFDPAPHTLRIESLDWDYRPVTVASFGFRLSP